MASSPARCTPWCHPASTTSSRGWAPACSTRSPRWSTGPAATGTTSPAPGPATTAPGSRPTDHHPYSWGSRRDNGGHPPPLTERCRMKSLGFILSYLTRPPHRRNLRVVGWLVLALAVLVVIFSVVFQVLMAHEGRHHSWITGVYWTLTTMSTLGFGDITFTSDAGRLFSAVVLLSGALFILVLLPFTFIQFVFMPWMASREAARAPRELPEGTAGHIVLATLGPIEEALIRRAKRARRPYVVLQPDLDTALSLHDQGYQVMVGELDDPDTYRAARVVDAALVASTLPDTTNANITFTVREIDGEVPVAVTASSAAAADVLRVAGADRVLQLGQMLGEAMARRVLGNADSHVVGSIDDLLVAEARQARLSETRVGGVGPARPV